MTSWLHLVRAEDLPYIIGTYDSTSMASTDLGKPGPMEIEVASGYDSQTAETKGDYSGAVAKTDKVEIALVKKLDRRILPTLWAMYFL